MFAERAKVVLSGEIKKAVTLKGVGATKGARAAIEAAGGKIEEAAAEAPKPEAAEEAGLSLGTAMSARWRTHAFSNPAAGLGELPVSGRFAAACCS